MSIGRFAFPRVTLRSRSATYFVAAFLCGSLAACTTRLFENGFQDHEVVDDPYAVEAEVSQVATRPAASTGNGEPGATALTGNQKLDGKWPLVLMYHDVFSGTLGADDVTPAAFVQQLDWLATNGYKTITLDEYHSYKQGKLKRANLPAKPVLLTFDDGYTGVYNHALPEIKKRSLNVVLFVHTAFVGSTNSRPKMTWDNYVEMEKLNDAQGRPLVRVYSHTHTHPVAPNGLASLNLALLQRELKDSKQLIESKLGGSRTFIAWPQGNYDTQVIMEAAAAGYTGGFAVGPPTHRVKAGAAKDPMLFQFGRVGVGSSLKTIADFAKRINTWQTVP